MHFSKLSLAAAAFICVEQVAAHATFQDFWSTCVRLPQSNSPITDVTSKDIRCNINSGPVAGKCAVAAGDTVAVEMHQQNGDRSCKNEAIGGQHWGPVQVYMSKVADSSSSSADGSSPWFKVFQDTWGKAPGSTAGDQDYWGTKDLTTCCGRMNVLIPTDLAAGDYLLRAEALALHAASVSGGYQFYVSCYQLTVSGTGTATPAGVSLPGAYKGSDPGIGLSIHQPLSGYVAPGPAVYSGGSIRVPGAACATGAEGGTTTGPAAPPATTKPGTTLTTKPITTTTQGGGNGGGSGPTTTAASGGGGNGCSVAKYAQCGGSGFAGCSTCASGSTCVAVSPPYYSQCQ